MKILLVMDPGILVPPKSYGGIERLLEIFAKEYHAMGHEVHLLVTEGSFVQGCTVHALGKEGFPPLKSNARKALLTAWKFLRNHHNDFDMVHNFGRLAYLIPILNCPVKKIMTYQREINNLNIYLINKIPNKNLVFTGCSFDLLSRLSKSGRWDAIYNAINFSIYNLTMQLASDAPLMFLGRIEKVKGCHTAIKLAKATGEKLIIAGNISPLPEEKAYFEKEIQPHIDGRQIIFAGALNDKEKDHYLGLSKALIFPIEWNEPFGIVMIEAMACGTPVVGFNRGSVGEVIEEGITGFKVESLDEMIKAVKNLHTIDREKCREHAQKRFDAKVIAKQYLQLFERPKNKVLIVTTGQPAANPRVLKEYETLKREGYPVKVLYTYSAEWSHTIDEENFRTGKLSKSDFILIGGNPFYNKTSYFFSRLFYKVFKIIVKGFPINIFKELTLARSSFFLLRAVKRHKAAIYITHYVGALPATVKAAGKHNAALIFDAEDFHRGEEPYYASQVKDVIETEDTLLPKVSLISAASPLISAAYKKLYPQKEVITINNVFSKNFIQEPCRRNDQQVKLFWFSQNIGPNRGLEVVIDALNIIGGNISLTLLGKIRNTQYVKELLKRATQPSLIYFLNPVNPEKIFEVASNFDIGLAAEIPYCVNRDICLTNKIFTYLLAGNCILASDTLAQKSFIETYQSAGLIYKNDDPVDLSNKLKLLIDNRELLAKFKNNSLKLASEKLNWEIESSKFLHYIELLNSSVVENS